MRAANLCRKGDAQSASRRCISKLNTCASRHVNEHTIPVSRGRRIKLNQLAEPEGEVFFPTARLLQRQLRRVRLSEWLPCQQSQVRRRSLITHDANSHAIAADNLEELRMPRLLFLLALMMMGTTACDRTPVRGNGPEVKETVCADISIPSIGSGSGTTTVCTTQSDCYDERAAAMQIDKSFCSDKSRGVCPAGNASCSNKCAGEVRGSGLAVKECVWNREKNCQIPGGGEGKECTCKWEIPAGKSLACGCGCQ